MGKPLDLEAIKLARENLAKIKAANPNMRAMTMDDLEQAIDAEVFSIPQVAALLKVHPETVRLAIRRGQLKAAKVGRAFRIARPDLEAYYKARGGGELFPAD